MRAFLFILLLPSIALSQELLPLTSNFYQSRLQNNQPLFKTAGDTLELPYLEEFSTSIVVPSSVRFIPNGGAYINNSYCVNAPTKNVASFDGLDYNGQTYSETNQFSRGKCDELTSRQINISGKSNVYMSFWWQAQGNAVPHVSTDSLQLSFLTSDSLWNVIWTQSGQALNEFQFEIIAIDSSYLHGGFQFKFENFANQSGMFGVWHIDYIYIDDDRSATDSIINDMAFSNRPSSYLEKYWAMPIDHFMEDPAAYISDSLTTTFNNFKNDGPSAPDFIIATSGEIIDTVSKNSFQTHSNPSNSVGQSERQKPIISTTNSSTLISGTPPYANTVVENKFVMEANDQNIGDTVNGQVVDFSTTQNDSISSYTTLADYYAYDDGSAEQAFRITTQDGIVVQEFELAETDTIYGMSVYFPGNTFQYDSNQLILMIWGEVNPGDDYNSDNILYDERVLIGVADSINGFTSYNFFEPVIVPAGKYYIGYRQDDDFDVLIGYDINSSPGFEPIYFNKTGTWKQFQLNDGVLMMRPHFKHIPLASISNKLVELDVNVFPNPARDMLNFSKPVEQIEIYDLRGGQVALSRTTTNQIDISALENGLYFLILQSEGKAKRIKFIKQ